MDGLNKMTIDEYRVIPDNRKQLYDILQEMGDSLCSISLGDIKCLIRLPDFSSVILTGLSWERYRNGKLDLVTLYKGLFVYDSMIKGLSFEKVEFIDNLIYLLSFDINGYTINKEEPNPMITITLCNGETLNIEQV